MLKYLAAVFSRDGEMCFEGGSVGRGGTTSDSTFSESKSPIVADKASDARSFEKKCFDEPV